jgi:hypothetical protein
VLGLRFVKDDGFATAMEANGIMVRVGAVPADFRPAQFPILGWQVADIEKMVAALHSQGVQLESFGFFQAGPTWLWTVPNGGRVAWFEDPDSKVLSVSPHV